MSLVKVAIPLHVGLNRPASGEYFCGRDASTALTMTILVRSGAIFARSDGSLHRGAFGRRGKSGQRRAPCFLTGRTGAPQGNPGQQVPQKTTAYVLASAGAGKGEKVR